MNAVEYRDNFLARCYPGPWLNRFHLRIVIAPVEKLALRDKRWDSTLTTLGKESNKKERAVSFIFTSEKLLMVNKKRSCYVLDEINDTNWDEYQFRTNLFCVA